MSECCEPCSRIAQLPTRGTLWFSGIDRLTGSLSLLLERHWSRATAGPFRRDTSRTWCGRIVASSSLSR
jgi:hypothetical protein